MAVGVEARHHQGVTKAEGRIDLVATAAALSVVALVIQEGEVLAVTQ